MIVDLLVRLTSPHTDDAVSATALALLTCAAVVLSPDGSKAQEPVEPKILGAPAAFAPIERQQEITIAAGTRIHQSPARRAPSIAVIDFDTTGPVIEWRGAWARVRIESTLGWALSNARLEDGESALPLSALPDSLRPIDVEPERLDAARALLGEHRSRTVGGYHLYGDISATRFERLATVLEGLDSAVGRRLGGRAVQGNEAVVVFARQAAYKTFVRGDDLMRGDASHLGQATAGLAVMSAEGLSVEQLEMLMVHEATHLASRRILGLGLPPWLEEGLAEDVAYHRRDAVGALIDGSLAPGSGVRIAESHFSDGSLLFFERELGGASALEALRIARRESRSISIPDLVTMSGPEFYASENPARYPLSGFFVRFLLEQRQEPFLRFLTALSRGELADTATLLAALGEPWSTLEADFTDWLEALQRRVLETR